MNKILSSILLATFFPILLSCTKENPIPPETGDRYVEIKDFDKIDVDGNVKVNVHYSPTFNGKVKIQSGQYDGSKVNLKVENKELYIYTDDNVGITENITIDIFVPVLTEIKLESKQHVIVYCDNIMNIPSLHIVTEAESRLELYNLNATAINSRQEASSELIISSALAPNNGPNVYSNNVTVVNKNSIQVNNTLIRGDSFVVNKSAVPATYTVLGKATFFAIITTGTFRGEGKSTIDISGMPVNELYLKMEGESQAKTWALHSLSGTGEGQSFVTYIGNPALSYITSGYAQIMSLN